MIIEELLDGHDDDNIKKNTREKNKGVIHSVSTENENWINWDPLDKVIKEWPDYTTPDETEVCVNNIDDYEN